MDIKKSALLVAALGSFVTAFMTASLTIALPSLGKAFYMDAVLLSWVSTVYLLAAAVFLVPLGRIADIYGRKKIFTYGMVIYTVSSFFAGVSPSPPFLLLFRVVQGVGGAMIFGTAVAIVTSVSPATERGKGIGINVAAVYAGLSLGPFLGGLLTQHLGWRSVFLINVPLGVVVILFVVTHLKGEWTGAPGEKVDLTGSVMYGLAFITVMYGISLLPLKTGLLFILLGFVGLILFVIKEVYTDTPILDMDLFFRNRVFALSSLTAFINYGTTFAVGFLLSLYLQTIQGLPAQKAGAILVCQPVVMVLFSPLAGRLSDRIEPRILASFGLVVTTGALFTFTRLTETTPVLVVTAQLAFLGAGTAFFSSPNTNAIMSSVKREDYGIASAVVATMRLMGQMGSMGVAVVVLSVSMGKVEIVPGYYGLFLESVKMICALFCGLCAGGVFVSLFRGEVRL